MSLHQECVLYLTRMTSQRYREITIPLMFIQQDLYSNIQAVFNIILNKCVHTEKMLCFLT